MTTEPQSLQGWAPVIDDRITLEHVIDLAFDYRGDVTVEKADGGEITGFLYNRAGQTARPFLQLFETEGGAQVTLGYDEIVNIRFTGRDTAAGQSYEAWKARRESSGGAERD